MKKITLVSTLVVALGTLAACTNNNAYGDVCEQALDAFPTLINFSTGKEVFVKEEGKIKALDYTMYLGLDTLSWTVNDKELNFELTWEAAPADKWAVSNYKTSDNQNRKKFRPLYGEEAFDCSLKATINCVNEKGKSIGHAERTWNFNAGTHQAPDLTDYEYVTCEQLAKGQVASNKKVYVYGYTTTSHEPSDTHLYTGVYMQDGAYGTLLYAGKLSQIWFSGGFEIGDRVMTAGVVSPYHGLVEVKPDFLEFTKDTDEKAAAVAQPVVNEFTAAKPFNEANGKDSQSSLVRVKGLTYKGIKVNGEVDPDAELSSTSTTSTVVFDQGGTQVVVSLNYHLGVDMMTALNALINTFVADQTVVDFYGPVSYYDGVQLIPTFGVESLTVVTA